MFWSVSHLLRVEHEMSLMNLLAFISCLKTIAHVSTDQEVSQMIDFVERLRIDKKHLIISTPKLNHVCLQNKTINFKVVIFHKQAGSQIT